MLAALFVVCFHLRRHHLSRTVAVAAGHVMRLMVHGGLDVAHLLLRSRAGACRAVAGGISRAAAREAWLPACIQQLILGISLSIAVEATLLSVVATAVAARACSPYPSAAVAACAYRPSRAVAVSTRLEAFHRPFLLHRRVYGLRLEVAHLVV